jgi:hypothetical protein
MLPNHVKYYGVDHPPLERLILRAGPLTMRYENGDLRYVRLGEREIIRRLYAAVRGPNWETAPNVLSNVQMQIEPDAFDIRYVVENRLNDIHFRWTGAINGGRDGTLTFSFDGEALSTFRRNRLGFCVLHPIHECAGAACRLEHADGSHDDTAFPVLIAPQLIKDGRPAPVGAFHSLRAMSYQVLPDLWAELRFEGDQFEMEDQRNWIDASFKTYCTPLSLPFPVEVPQGTHVRQTVRLRLQGTLPAPEVAATTPQSVTLVRPHAAVPQVLPGLGLSRAGHGEPLSDREVARLRTLTLAHLRTEIRLAHADWRTDLAQAAAEANAIGTVLELVLVATDDPTIFDAVADELDAVRPPLAALLIWHEREMVAPAPVIAAARRAFARFSPALPLGAGSKANFAELNRAWPEASLLDFVSVAANPQVHARDVTSIAETGAAFLPLVATTQHVMNGLPLAVSALTLRPQFNPVATGPLSPPPPGELPPPVDPLQVSLFAAGWLVSSLKHLTEAGGVRYVSAFETTGWLGVMDTEAGSPLPEKFAALPGGVYPCYHVLAALGEMRDGHVLPVQSSDPLRVEGLLLQRGERLRLLVASLDSVEVHVSLPAFGSVLTAWVLDETTFMAAAQTPEVFRTASTPLTDPRTLVLRPFAIACLDYATSAGERPS